MHCRAVKGQARASQVIDPVAARHTAVHTEGKVLLTLTNGPATPEVVIILRHKKNPGACLPHAPPARLFAPHFFRLWRCVA
jgi:hypothetical protein